ncbi:MAG: hypothetical protein ACTSR8_20400 [Promethearchaeota archaeon]
MNIKLIDRTYNIIQKEKYKKFQIKDYFLRQLTDLMEKIEEYGSYWKRGAITFSEIYSRDEIILQYLRILLFKCDISWDQNYPILKIKETREKSIKKYLNRVIDDLSL